MDPNAELNTKDFNNPERAKTWAVDNKSIYDPALAVKNDEGKTLNNGPIADSDAAQEVAVTESIQGRDAALAVEKKLEGEANTGLTEDQKTNLAIMEGLTIDAKGEPINTHAFIDKIDSKGRKYRIFHPSNSMVHFPSGSILNANQVVFCCMDGVYRIDSRDVRLPDDEIAEAIEWSDVGDYVNNVFVQGQAAVQLRMYYKNSSGELDNVFTYFRKLDLLESSDFKLFTNLITYSEEKGKEIESKKLKPELSAEKILDSIRNNQTKL